MNKEQLDLNISENSWKKYTENELEIIFSLPPTINNIKRLSKLLKRTERGISQQYQWAMLSDKMIKEKNIESWTTWDINMPCRKIAKKLWWIQTY